MHGLSLLRILSPVFSFNFLVPSCDGQFHAMPYSTEHLHLSCGKWKQLELAAKSRSDFPTAAHKVFLPCLRGSSPPRLSLSLSLSLLTKSQVSAILFSPLSISLILTICKAILSLIILHATRTVNPPHALFLHACHLSECIPLEGGGGLHIALWVLIAKKKKKKCFSWPTTCRDRNRLPADMG